MNSVISPGTIIQPNQRSDSIPREIPRSDFLLPGLDGLRALFMFMVLLVHLGLLGCGWIGVQWFFVLSGFLITRILLADAALAMGWRKLFIRFYARRSLRIFPIYYLYIVGLVAFASISGRLAELQPYLTAASVYAYNIFGLFSAYDYTHRPALLLDHTWTLAVEEQFYLLWPLAIACVPRRFFGVFLTCLIILAPAFRLAVVSNWPFDSAALLQISEAPYRAVYLLPLSHVDAFAFGAAINLVRRLPSPKVFWLCALAGLAAGIALNGYGDATVAGVRFHLTLGYPNLMMSYGQYVWGYTLVAAIGALLIAAVQQPNVLQRIFSHPWLVWMGQRSYGAYLYHVAVLMLFESVRAWLSDLLGSNYFAGVILLPFVLLALACISGLSYRYIEQPMLRLKDRAFPRLQR